MYTIEPIIEAYRSGNPMNIAIQTFNEQNPNEPLAFVLKKIDDAYTNLSEFESAISATKNLDYKTYTIEEQLIFLLYLCQLYMEADRISSATATLGTIKRLITPSLPSEWQIIPFLLEANIYKVAGYHRKNLMILEKCLEMLGINSGRYKSILFMYLTQICLINDLEKFESGFLVYKKLVENTSLSKRIDYLLLLKNLESGEFNLFEPLIQNIKTDISLLKLVNNLKIFENFNRIFYQNDIEFLDENNPNDWHFFSSVCLLKNNVKKALFFAHKIAEKSLDYIMESSFFSYIPLRAELANGNINAAEYTLENKKKYENFCLYDDFFWFRIHHLKGNIKIAQHFFNLFTANVEKYKLEKRFDLELRLSPNLTFTDIRNYSLNSKNPSESPLPPSSTGLPSFDKTFHFLIGKSPEIKNVIDLVIKFANVDTNVLIIGETGTGKELVAQALWQSGPYKNKPFIPINCGAISDHLLQSELFGHKKGAFTGAFQDHKGVFESADEGIVFLDEIGEISPSMQISLLRILESREYRPVGSNEIKKLKCKILAATNQNLGDLVKKGLFRQDLQYRLERLTIPVPSLRSRSTDISILIDHFLNKMNPNLPPIAFDLPTLQLLSNLPWPGNIRELRNEMERIRLFYSDKKILSITELSEKYRAKTILPENQIGKTSTKSTLMNISPLNVKSKFRKLEELKLLFNTHTNLSRVEVAKLLQVSSNTAANYLKALEEENIIKKVISNKTKFQYYESNKLG